MDMNESATHSEADSILSSLEADLDESEQTTKVMIEEIMVADVQFLSKLDASLAEMASHPYPLGP